MKAGKMPFLIVDLCLLPGSEVYTEAVIPLAVKNRRQFKGRFFGDKKLKVLSVDGN